MAVGNTVTQVIKSWIDDRVLFQCEVSADLNEGLRIRAALELGVMSGANLSGADLSGANLSRANLSGADLSGADLIGANLSGHKIIPGAARSDGYAFMLTKIEGEGWRIRAGCRNFTLDEARKHWQKPRDKESLNAESLLIVEQLLALAKLRGWDVNETTEQENRTDAISQNQTS